jgi:hypothetical protein
MNNLMQQLLGADWERLPQALQTHYASGQTCDQGYLDVEFPRWMQPFLLLLSKLGALVARRGPHTPTEVCKQMQTTQLAFHRTLRFATGKTVYFDSIWRWAGANRFTEYVNPWLGVQMAVRLHDGCLCYEGVCYIICWGKREFRLPEWLLGHATIREWGCDTTSFAMDFRLTHPIFGQVFRYAGVFSTKVLSCALNTPSQAQ